MFCIVRPLVEIYLFFVLFALKSFKKSGNVCSAGPIKIVSAYFSASSGIAVTCNPPRATNIPLSLYCFAIEYALFALVIYT